MPRNRSELPRDQKVEEILDAAERALCERGLAGLSLAALARELGLAQNSIYWYFGDKDGLLLALLHRATKRALEDLAIRAGAGPVEQLVAAVDRLSELTPFEAAMRARSPHSATIAAFEAEFDASLRSLLRDVLRAHVDRRRLDDVADAYELAATGALARRTPARRRRRVLRETLNALLARATDRPEHLPPR